MTLELICKKAYESILINNEVLDSIYLNKIVRWNSSDWQNRKKSKMVKIKFVLLLTTFTLQAQGKWNSLIISGNISTNKYFGLFESIRSFENSGFKWAIQCWKYDMAHIIWPICIGLIQNQNIYYSSAWIWFNSEQNWSWRLCWFQAISSIPIR